MVYGYESDKRDSIMVCARLFRIALPATLLLCLGSLMRSDPAATGSSGRSSSADREIVGTWKLVSIYEEDDQGYELNEFEDGAMGQFIAGQGNNFSLQILSPSARRYTPKGPSCVPSAGLIDAITYFGTYTPDRQNQKLTLHIKNCLFRRCDGIDFTVSIKISGDTMDWISAGTASPTGAAYNHIVWRRVCCSAQH